MAPIGDLWSLPGPLRYANSVRASLEHGFSATCVLPAFLLDTPLWAEGLHDAMDLSVDVLDDDSERAVSAIVCDALGLTPVLGRDAAAELGRAEAVAGRILEITLPADHDRAKDWVRFVTEFVASSKSVGIADRPRFLVLTAHPAAEFFTDRALLLNEHWWWGVLSRIDTTIFVSRVVDTDTDPAIVESIIEVVGHDLHAAQDLAAEWDGSLSSLLDLIPPLATAAEHQTDPVHYGSRGQNTTPVRGLRAAWDAGILDSWDRYQTFLSPHALTPEQHEYVLNTRVWRAQLRELMPFIDEERQRLEEWVRGVPKENEPEYPMEIGRLAWIIKWDSLVRRASSSRRREAADWLRTARNVLAHRGTLSPDEVAKGRRLLDDDRRSER